MSKTYNKYKINMCYTVSLDCYVIAESEEEAYDTASWNINMVEYMNGDIGAETDDDRIEIESLNCDGEWDRWNATIELDEVNVKNPYDEEDKEEDDEEEDDDEEDENND